MSKRPISYTIPTTPERPAKRRQVSSSSFSGYQQAPEPNQTVRGLSTRMSHPKVRNATLQNIHQLDQ